MFEMMGYYITGVILFFSGIYIICLRFKNYALIDIAWGLGFILLVFLGMKQSEYLSAPQYLISTCIFLWGVRLSSYLFLRNFGKPEDFRYLQMRIKWGKYANVHAYFKVFMLQAVLVCVIGLPIIFKFYEEPTRLGPFQIAGFILWGFGFIWESWADQEKSKFKSIVGNKERPCDTGPWRYSQYANYFGEVVLWWGIFLISLPSQYFYLSLVSPALITFLILKVSGIPFLEEKNSKKENYQAYRSKTNKFFPWKPRTTQIP